jgi:hypothetical protein
MPSAEERFNRLHEEHFESIRRYAWRREPALADDIVAENLPGRWFIAHRRSQARPHTHNCSAKSRLVQRAWPTFGSGPRDVSASSAASRSCEARAFGRGSIPGRLHFQVPSENGSRRSLHLGVIENGESRVRRHGVAGSISRRARLFSAMVAALRP